MRATYELGLLVATDLPEVDLRGRLAFDAEPVVPCLCISMEGLCAGLKAVGAVGLEGTRECRRKVSGLGAAKGFTGSVDEDTVLE